MDQSQLPVQSPGIEATPGSPPCPAAHAALIPLPSEPEWKYYDVTPPAESPANPLEGSPANSSPPPDPLVAVIGVGYVGEHLVDVFSRRFHVTGFDVSESRVKDLTAKYTDNMRVEITSDPLQLSKATHFLISVPTLLLPDKSVDTSYLRSALTTVGKHATRGSTIVFESSVAVGMTRKLLGPLAASQGWYAGMSPERVDPGRTEPAAYDIAKVISGLDDVVPGSLAAIHKLYSAAFNKVITVSQPEVAEMTKLYENCQRMVNISFANEMANACLPFKIDPYEVCRAAATKPFGYMPYAPGLGVGGHCIPVNPYYLLSTSHFPLLKAASEAMYARPAEIGQRAIDALYANPASAAGLPRILVVGMGFKRGQSHLVNSPGLELAKSLVLSEKVAVSFADPLVTQEAVPQITRLDEANWTVAYLEENFDMIIVSFKQDGLDFEILGQLKDSVKVQMWCA
ncbi:nucleotide sugar dehydrogenase [Trichoderma citrinoviride]|uniref:Nucleotide sugar dehydrogenase n=1 Tax=Trichoderma citrinoviride TaxID=58853 RepID=A0A2T4BA06_9HYPO|nr:nucleotide sugar dehydrogenase [Trichoderma citrinoviride]PTB66157.1 nucleotide sugar dehydrogenase [Trichoderma citrinoviride]